MTFFPLILYLLLVSLQVNAKDLKMAVKPLVIMALALSLTSPPIMLLPQCCPNHSSLLFILKRLSLIASSAWRVSLAILMAHSLTSFRSLHKYDSQGSLT